ncbi:MAG: response regulator [bacterium]
MQTQVVLIIDSRKELSQKYKKIIQQDCHVHPVISHDIQEAFNKIQELEPDLIIVCDNFDENINDLCKKIRKQTGFYRPVLVVLSKSSYLEDKLNVLKSGADDYLSEPIEPSEFSIRIFAHLRRHIEELSDLLSKLPSANITYRVLRRIIKSNNKWALMYLDIDNFNPYIEIYGHLAGNNLLKAFSAILKTSVDQEDFIGHIGEKHFIILTSPNKADKIAAFLSYAFDAIATKFYANEDVKRGYLIINGDDKAGRRVPFVSTSIGIISNQYRDFDNYQEALNFSVNIHKLAKIQPGSSWIIDRPKISTENNIEKFENKPKKILIIETDAALAYLLTTTLEMQGYKVEITSNFNDAVETVNYIQPDLILIDTGDKDLEKALEICGLIKKDKKLCLSKVIISTVIHDKEKILDTGADLYLPKPYELMTLFSWISKFLKVS